MTCITDCPAAVPAAAFLEGPAVLYESPAAQLVSYTVLPSSSASFHEGIAALHVELATQTVSSAT